MALIPAVGFVIAENFRSFDTSYLRLRTLSYDFVIATLGETDHLSTRRFRLNTKELKEEVILEILIGDLASYNDSSIVKIQNQIEFAYRNNVMGIYFKCPESPRLIDILAHIIKPRISESILADSCSAMKFYIELSVDRIDKKCSWSRWNRLRSQLPPNQQVMLSLTIKQESPPLIEIRRWAGEPVAFVRVGLHHLLPDDCRLAEKCFAEEQITFMRYIQTKRHFSLIIDAPSRIIGPIANIFKCQVYPEIVKFYSESSLWRTYNDRPAPPLQPLKNNLSCPSYGIFEEDPVKYELYHRAIHSAMVDLAYSKLDGTALSSSRPQISPHLNSSSAGSTSSASSSVELDAGFGSYRSRKGARPSNSSQSGDAFQEPGPLKPYENHWTKYVPLGKCVKKLIDREKASQVKLTVVVAGAGRGPLVKETLKAAELIGIDDLTVHAIEKNPLVIDYLQEKVTGEWASSFPLAKVLVHHIDMRDFKLKEKVDLVVSELLGSFSDNELSPECLHGLFENITGDFICIPQSYRSFLQPIMSDKAYFRTCDFARSNNIPLDQVLQSYHSMRFRNFFSAASSKMAFRFDHYNYPSSYNRYPRKKETIQLNFKNKIDFLCHGFAGYFTAHLYDGFWLRTRPEAHTKDLISWYPVFFPLIQPILVQANQGIGLQMTRRSSENSVWYELRALLPPQNKRGECQCQSKCRPRNKKLDKDS